MSNESFRQRMQSAELLLGTWIGSTDPMVTEAAAGSAFEFLIIDAEHGSLDRLPLVTNLIAARAAGVRTLVRLGGDDPTHYMHALDNGADGVIVPRVKTVADVERAVDLCRYPPHGSRGFGPHRAGGYYRNEAEYVSHANDLVAVLVQVETREAVQNLDGILAVEGLDGILVGRNDLAGSLGLPRDHRNPQLLKIAGEILSSAKQRGLARAIAAEINPAEVGELVELGANIVAAGGDLEFMVRAIDSYLVEVDAAVAARRDAERSG